MIVEKAVNMAKKMNVPILGLVENMSYLECPDCGKKISVFGESHLDEVAKSMESRFLAQIPIRPAIAEGRRRGNRGVMRKQRLLRRCREGREGSVNEVRIRYHAQGS